MVRERMRAPSSDELAAVALGLILCTAYYATLKGITVSNDGSHYALTRALADHGSFEISAYLEFTELIDYARVGDRVYSDRPPGTALVAALFYRAGQLLPAPARPMSSLHDSGNPALPYVLMLPVLCGALALVVMYRFMLARGVHAVAAWFACCAVGLGTLQWKYSAVLYSHAVSGLFVTLSFVMSCALDERSECSRRMLMGLGLCLGFAVLIEYQNVLLLPLVLMVSTCRRRRLQHARKWFESVSALLLFAALPLGFLLTYNAALFGGPLSTSYAHTATHTWTHSWSGIFSGPMLVNLVSLLLFAPWDAVTVHGPVKVEGSALQGLFCLSPILLLCIPGWLSARRTAVLRRPALLLIVLTASYLVVISAHATAHGFTRDSRYLAPLVPLSALPLGVWVQRVLLRPSAAWRALLAQSAMFALCFVSIVQIALHIGFSYDYELHWSELSEMAASAANYRTVGRSVMPNLADALRIWPPALLIAAIWLSMRCRIQAGQSRTTADPRGASRLGETA